MHTVADDALLDWSQCSLVEVNPRKVSGVPIIKGTRVQANAVLENYEDGSLVEEIAEHLAIPETMIRELLIFAASQKNHCQP